MSTSLRITYWAEQNGENSITPFEGMSDFKESLSNEYLTVVHGRPGDLGGLYQLAVSFVSEISLADVVKFLAAGVAYDAIKSGTKSFVLNPFLEAYRKLRQSNAWAGIDIEDLRLEFQESIVAMDATYDQAIPDQIKPILLKLSELYPKMILRSGEAPFEIRIPVLEDTTEDSVERFRAVLEVDEMIAKRNASDYFGYWGLWYDYSRQYRVIDIGREILLDAKFISREDYWKKTEERWRERRG